jgi:hypothetical protein
LVTYGTPRVTTPRKSASIAFIMNQLQHRSCFPATDAKYASNSKFGNSQVEAAPVQLLEHEEQ